MGEVVSFQSASRRTAQSLLVPAQVSYETYVAYQQAEAAFRAIYFGRTHPEPLANRPSAKIVQRQWATVEQLAETLLREKSLSREQVLKLLLRANLDEAIGAEK